MFIKILLFFLKLGIISVKDYNSLILFINMTAEICHLAELGKQLPVDKTLSCRVPSVNLLLLDIFVMCRSGLQTVLCRHSKQS